MQTQNAECIVCASGNGRTTYLITETKLRFPATGICHSVHGSVPIYVFLDELAHDGHVFNTNAGCLNTHDFFWYDFYLNLVDL